MLVSMSKSTEKLTEKIADQTHSFGVKAAYGEPIEQDGNTIIPVAISGFGFGAGEAAKGGEEAAENSEAGATGGGAGGWSAPVGAYITRDGVTRFEPNLITLLVVATPFVCFAGRAVARIIKALKK